MFENVIATTAVLTLMLGGVIGAMDNVQSFIGFFYGFPEPCGRKLKEQRYTQPLCSGANLATVLFSHVVES